MLPRQPYVIRTNHAPSLTWTNGGIECLKWLALALMVVDHINKYLLHYSTPIMFELGRISMPLFAFVLGYNLARPGLLDSKHGWRIARRMLLAGCVATVPFMALGTASVSWWPLNIMMMLALATTIAQLLGGPVASAWRVALAVLLFVVAGLFVEYWWLGVATVLTAWRYARRPSVMTLALWIGALASLQLINGNAWALATVPLVLAASRVQLRLPRLRWFSYAFYPLHLAVIWCVIHWGAPA